MSIELVIRFVIFLWFSLDKCDKAEGKYENGNETIFVEGVRMELM
jgi:hypothetical protein